MIKLKLRRCKRRSKAKPQNGRDQSIYRALSIAMLSDTEPMLTAWMVISVGFDPAELKALYQAHGDALYNWARAKGIVKDSDNLDKEGNLLRPGMWTPKHWQERVADQLWNQAAKILDEGFDMQAADFDRGIFENTYWYSIRRGVYRVSPAEYSGNLEITLRIHAVMLDAKNEKRILTEQDAAVLIEEEKQNRLPQSENQVGLTNVPVGDISRQFRFLGAFAALIFCLLMSPNKKTIQTTPISRIAGRHYRLHAVPSEVRVPRSSLVFKKVGEGGPKFIPDSSPLLTPVYVSLKDH